MQSSVEAETGSFVEAEMGPFVVVGIVLFLAHEAVAGRKVEMVGVDIEGGAD